MSFKQSVYTACLELLEGKIQYLDATLDELTAGAENDAKSSAGDKHETARAMMQLEYEKIGIQREEFLRQKGELEQIEISNRTGHVKKGSLINTNHGYLFLSVPIGKITIDGVLVIALSPQSPLGQKLLNLKEGNSVEVNQVEYVIEEIL